MHILHSACPILFRVHTCCWVDSSGLFGLIWDLRRLCVASEPLERHSQRKRKVLHWELLVTDAAHVAGAAQTLRKRRISDFSRGGRRDGGDPEVMAHITSVALLRPCVSRPAAIFWQGRRMRTCRGGTWFGLVMGGQGGMERGLNGRERLQHRFPFVYLRCKRLTVCAG